ncbi:MAG: hypothetical protein ABIO94_11315 [Opitutaceae bacterium]
MTIKPTLLIPGAVFCRLAANGAEGTVNVNETRREIALETERTLENTFVNGSCPSPIFIMDAIIIVDVQKAFPIPHTLVQRINERARAFPRRIFTQFVNEPESLFRTKLKRTSCPPGAEETELIIAPGPDDWVIQKPRYSLSSQCGANCFSRH